MGKLKNEGGFFSVESAVIMPLLLIATCVILSLFYCFIKWGALDLIFNHQLITDEIGLKPVYNFGQLVDSYTDLEVERKESALLEGATQLSLKGSAVIKAPFLKEPTVWRSEAKQYHIPIFYQIKASQLMEGQLNALRGKLGHE